jgi:hypothetical protein
MEGGLPGPAAQDEPIAPLGPPRPLDFPPRPQRPAQSSMQAR